MSLSDNEVSDGKQGNSESPQSGNILFLGDVGDLAFETRRVLVQLLAGPSLDGRRHPKLWPILQRDEPVIRRRLADLFLELVVDRDLQVAFTKQADGGELEIPILLRRLQLTFLDSVLLLFLRQRLAQADAQGERAVIASEEVEEYLSLYEHTTNTDKAGFRKRIQASMEKLKQNSILQKLRSGDDRFEISPTLKLLFSADEIQALAKLYERMSSTTSEHHTAESSELESDDKVDQ
jgi:hypothetical protein